MIAEATLLEPIAGNRMREVREIVCHHSVTPDQEVLDASAIRRYHMDPQPRGNGWSDVGYHYLVERDGRGVFQVVKGRPDDRSGAHCRGHNGSSIGVCFVGNYDVAPPPIEMLHVAANRLIVPLLLLHRLNPGCIVGDRDHHPSKTCPGRFFDIDAFRQIVCDYLRARRR